MNFDELIERNDPDEVLREIDRLCERRDWDALSTLVDRCHQATERGKQLWGAAAHGEYRMALEASPSFAALAIDAMPSPFALGPLAEVVASTHSWAELKPHLSAGPLRAVVAYERVARGEDLTEDSTLESLPVDFEVPLVLDSWEPKYPDVLYTASSAVALRPMPAIDRTVPVERVSFDLIDDSETSDALSALVTPWLTESNGTQRTAIVAGGIQEVASAVNAGPEVLRISLQSAVSLMAWAAASGGVHGRRRGLSVGRRNARRALEAVVDAPVSTELFAGLECFTWGNQDAEANEIAIALVNPAEGLGFAFHATDHKD